MLSATLLLCQVAAQVRVVEQAGESALFVGRTRYELGEHPSMSLDGGELRPSGPNAPETPPLGLGWYREGQQIAWVDLAKLVSDWLNQDEVWGGHREANQLRYMAHAGGGIYAQLIEAYPQPDQTSLGTLAIREGGPSGEPIAAEFLVRFYPAPFRLERLRPIQTPGDRFGWIRHPKLFPYEGHLFLVTADQVLQLKPDGSVKQKWMDLPKGTVLDGLAAHRWLVSERSPVSGFDVTYEVTDLVRKATFALLTYRGTNPPLIQAPVLMAPPRPDSSFLLFDQGRYDNQKGTRFTVHLPDGQRATMPSDAVYLAGSYVVCSENQKTNVVSAETGKPVK